MRLYLRWKIPSKRGNNHVWPDLFEYLENIILLQVVPYKLFVLGERAIGVICAVGIKIGAEFFVYGIAHKSTRT